MEQNVIARMGPTGGVSKDLTSGDFLHFTRPPGGSSVLSEPATEFTDAVGVPADPGSISLLPARAGHSSCLAPSPSLLLVACGYHGEARAMPREAQQAVVALPPAGSQGAAPTVLSSGRLCTLCSSQPPVGPVTIPNSQVRKEAQREAVSCPRSYSRKVRARFCSKGLLELFPMQINLVTKEGDITITLT